MSILPNILQKHESIYVAVVDVARVDVVKPSNITANDYEMLMLCISP